MPPGGGGGLCPDAPAGLSYMLVNFNRCRDTKQAPSSANLRTLCVSALPTGTLESWFNETHSVVLGLLGLAGAA